MKYLSSRGFRLLRWLVAVNDFACLEMALLVGYWIWTSITFPWHVNFQPFSTFALILVILPPVGIVVFKAVGLYKPEMGIMGVQEQSLIFKATGVTYLIVFASSFFIRTVQFSRLSIFYSFFISVFLLSVERFLWRRFFEWLNEKGVAVLYAIIYGAGHQGQRLERWIQQSPQLGIRVVGYLDDHVEGLVKKPENSPVLGKLEDLNRFVKSKNISLLFIAHRNLDESKVIEIFHLCKGLGIQCWVIPSLYRFHVEKASLLNIGGIPLVSFREGFARRTYEIIKRLFDIELSLILIFLLAPLAIFIAVGVFIQSGWPVLFRQIRVGEKGRKFTMLKFRTLRPASRKDEVSPELQKGSKKLNPFFALLRRTGLDELPQLINVLRGEMSIVGPRPEMPFIVDKYGPLERERLNIKPGITGLWQISKERKKLFIHENMDYDLYYVEHLSFNLDLAILVKTIWTVLSRIFERGGKGRAR